jgi:uncharacterized protein YlxW (UPF0749 family)
VSAEAAGRPPAGPDSPATIGLLPFLSGHALDDDYRAVADRAQGAAAATRPVEHGARTGRRRPSALWTVAVLAAFVVLLITAATQTSRNAVADEKERTDLITQIKQRKAAVHADTVRIERLRTQVESMRTQLLDNEALSARTRSELERLSVSTGTTPVRGPGVSVTVDDAKNADSPRSTVLDSDLQMLVNGLWQAGAEAVAINGERLTALSSIRGAGSAITVNDQSLSRPYVVQAIGDPRSLPNRFGNTESGQAWLDLQKEVGLRFSMRTRTKMSLPGAGVPMLRDARQPRTGSEAKEGTS